MTHAHFTDTWTAASQSKSWQHNGTHLQSISSPQMGPTLALLLAIPLRRQPHHNQKVDNTMGHICKAFLAPMGPTLALLLAIPLSR